MPKPALVRLPLPAITLDTLSVELTFGLSVPPPAPRVTPRLPVQSVNVAMVSRVPPLKVNWSAVRIAGSLPRQFSPLMESTPALRIVLPV